MSNSKIYRTDLDGSIMLKIKNNKLQIETCNPKKEIIALGQTYFAIQTRKQETTRIDRNMI